MKNLLKYMNLIHKSVEIYGNMMQLLDKNNKELIFLS